MKIVRCTLLLDLLLFILKPFPLGQNVSCTTILLSTKKKRGSEIHDYLQDITYLSELIQPPNANFLPMLQEALGNETFLSFRQSLLGSTNEEQPLDKEISIQRRFVGRAITTQYNGLIYFVHCTW